MSVSGWIPALHPKGKTLVIGLAAVSVVLWLFSSTLGWLGALATLVAVMVFRDPPRQVPQGNGMVLAPVDGIVTAIEEAELPEALGLDSEASFTRITMHLGWSDIRINRVPVSGSVVRDVYVPETQGDTKESAMLAVQTEKEELVAVVQASTVVPRQVLSEVYEGETLEQGQRYGLMRLGSVCELYVPSRLTVLVAQGTRVVAGETVVAGDAKLYKPWKLTWKQV